MRFTTTRAPILIDDGRRRGFRESQNAEATLALQRYTLFMGALRAKVKNGRLILNAPTRLPEGTILNLVVDDEGDHLTAADRRRLHRAMSSALRQAQAGQGRSASEVIASLRKRR